MTLALSGTAGDEMLTSAFYVKLHISFSRAWPQLITNCHAEGQTSKAFGEIDERLLICIINEKRNCQTCLQL